ncbi:MAG TPA: hypothetical protein EYO33_29860 [Phycisphaerales bacterium]|nr:hypothetical protein [Phycisphaerales bacterium]
MLKSFFTVLLLVFLALPILADGRTIDITKLGNVNGRMHVSGEDKPYTGKVLFHYPSGKLRQEAVFVNGKANGPTTAYYESGKKWMEFNNKNDNAHGWMTKWDENGKVVEKTYWENGKKIK